MNISSRAVDDLIRIATAGGGFRVDATVHTLDNLIRIAAAAGAKGSRVTVVGASIHGTDSLVRIAAAGNGAVEFVD
ncbi:hypothetical protein CupriaWKF_33285 [Cupriavidus sp. WKF15]|uniref:hypothetical protein n=1 Tax=Cupriavidus sp. WKF15 TaxID=3032282 RepID=UPI0023E146F4|nr:hypothetical protein [Cupriavidus sp. WKF15]WER50437.1 hypothetical protein CupriaWKF_33285 [Cupriavidus sp. WKF15]